MDENTLKALIAPTVVGVVEALAQAGVPKTYAAIISIVLGGLFGILIGLSYQHTGNLLIFDAMVGLGAGAIGTGAYKLTQNIATTVVVESASEKTTVVTNP